MSGKHCAGQVIKASATCVTPIALPMWLGIIMTSANHPATATSRTPHSLRPAVLTHQGEAFGIVKQGREIDQFRAAHGRGLLRRIPLASHQIPFRSASPITPDPDKSLGFLQRLIRYACRKVFLILDNLPAHRAKLVRAWLAAHGTQIEVFYLPSYSPELNPDEGG
jgi:DDE superfamily endonuclease